MEKGLVVARRQGSKEADVLYIDYINAYIQLWYYRLLTLEGTGLRMYMISLYYFL